MSLYQNPTKTENGKESRRAMGRFLLVIEFRRVEVAVQYNMIVIRTQHTENNTE